MTVKRVPLPTGPLYINGSDDPVTIDMIEDNISALNDALIGISMTLEAIPENTENDPPRLMIQLAIDYMNTVLGRLIPVEGYEATE